MPNIVYVSGYPPLGELAKFDAVYICGPGVTPDNAAGAIDQEPDALTSLLQRVVAVDMYVDDCLAGRLAHVAADIHATLYDQDVIRLPPTSEANNSPSDDDNDATSSHRDPIVAFIDALSREPTPGYGSLVLGVAYAMYASDKTAHQAIQLMRNTSGINFQPDPRIVAALCEHNPGQGRITMWGLVHGRDLATQRMVPHSPK